MIKETHSTTIKVEESTNYRYHHASNVETTTKSTKGIEHHSSNIYDSDIDIIKSHSE